MNKTEKSNKNHSRKNIIQVSFSEKFIENLNKAVGIKCSRNKQDLIRRAVEDYVENILEGANKNG